MKNSSTHSMQLSHLLTDGSDSPIFPYVAIILVANNIASEMKEKKGFQLKHRYCSELQIETLLHETCTDFLQAKKRIKLVTCQ